MANSGFSPKMPKKTKFFRKFFLVGIDLEWFKTYFKMKISILKIFSHWKFFFLGHSRFFEKLVTKISKKFRKKFLVGIDLEWFKTCFKTKISILKIFSHWFFFQGHSCFFEKCELLVIWQKWQSQKLAVVRSSLEIGDSTSGGSLAPNFWGIKQHFQKY